MRVNPDIGEDAAELMRIRRSKGFIVLVTNIPFPEEDPSRGMEAEDAIRLYSQQRKVECGFATMKKPAIADRLFLEKQGRAETPVCLFCMGVLPRGPMQVLLRRGLSSVPDADSPVTVWTAALCRGTSPMHTSCSSSRA